MKTQWIIDIGTMNLDKPIFDFGDSLVPIEIRNWIRRDFGGFSAVIRDFRWAECSHTC